MRNEVLHSKQPPQVDVFVRFLASYVSSLISRQSNPNVDPIQRKTIAVFNQMSVSKQTTCNIKEVGVVCSWTRLIEGKVKLNTNASVLGDVCWNRKNFVGVTMDQSTH